MMKNLDTEEDIIKRAGIITDTRNHQDAIEEIVTVVNKMSIVLMIVNTIKGK